MRSRYDDGGPPDPPEDPSVGVVEDILEEYERRRRPQSEGGTPGNNSVGIEAVLAHLGRAAGRDFRGNMIKAAAAIVSAIIAHADPADTIHDDPI